MLVIGHQKSINFTIRGGYLLPVIKNGIVCCGIESYVSESQPTFS